MKTVTVNNEVYIHKSDLIKVLETFDKNSKEMKTAPEKLKVINVTIDSIITLIHDLS